MVRFLQTSDWQLGMTRHFLRGEAQARYSDARLAAVRRLGEIAGEQGCELIVVAGDVFDANQVSSQTVRRALEVLREVPVPVWLLPGNHDPVSAASVYDSEVFAQGCPPHVHVLRSAGVHEVRPGLELVAAPWSGKHPDADLCAAALAGLEAAPAGVTRVLVGHGGLDALAPPGREHPAHIALAGLEEALDAGVIHWAALGDRHSRLGVGRTGRVHYSGTQEVTDFREEIPGDVLVVSLPEGGEPVVEHHHVGTWKFTSLRLDVTDDSVDAVDAALAALAHKERRVVRHALTGTLTLAGQAELKSVLASRGELFASLHPWGSATELAVVVGLDDVESLGATGFVRAAVDELVAVSRGEAPGVAASGGTASSPSGVTGASGASAADSTSALALLHRLAGAATPTAGGVV